MKINENVSRLSDYSDCLRWVDKAKPMMETLSLPGSHFAWCLTPFLHHRDVTVKSFLLLKVDEEGVFVYMKGREETKGDSLGVSMHVLQGS